MTGNDVYNMFRSEDKGARHAPLFDNTVSPRENIVLPVGALESLQGLAITPMIQKPTINFSEFNPFKKKRNWDNATEIVPDEIPKYVTLDEKAEAEVLANAIPDVPWYRFDKKAEYVADQLSKEVTSGIDSIGGFVLRGVILAGAVAIVLLGLYLFIKQKSLGAMINKVKGG